MRNLKDIDTFDQFFAALENQNVKEIHIPDHMMKSAELRLLLDIRDSLIRIADFLEQK